MNDALHAALQDDLAAYSLRSLDDLSALRVEEHLLTCAECRSILREYQEVARLLPLTLSAAPPDGARASLLAAAMSDRRSGAETAATAGVRPVRRFPGRAAVLAAAALLALALAGGFWALSRDRAPMDPAEVVEQLLESDDVRVVALTGSEAAPGAVGQVIFRPTDKRAGLVASGLPNLERGHCYQLWLIRADGSRTSGGIFWEDDDGSAITLVELPEDLSQFLWLGVTEEPYPGSETPTGRNILRGDF